MLWFLSFKILVQMSNGRFARHKMKIQLSAKTHGDNSEWQKWAKILSFCVLLRALHWYLRRAIRKITKWSDISSWWLTSPISGLSDKLGVAESHCYLEMLSYLLTPQKGSSLLSGLDTAGVCKCLWDLFLRFWASFLSILQYLFGLIFVCHLIKWIQAFCITRSSSLFLPCDSWRYSGNHSWSQVLKEKPRPAEAPRVSVGIGCLWAPKGFLCAVHLCFGSSV